MINKNISIFRCTFGQIYGKWITYCSLKRQQSCVPLYRTEKELEDVESFTISKNLICYDVLKYKEG